MRTSMAIETTLLSELSYALDGNRVRGPLIPGVPGPGGMGGGSLPCRRTVPRASRVFHLDRLFGDLAVRYPVRTELGFVLIPGRYQDVMRLRLAGVRDVRARRVRLGGGVRVVDHHRFLVTIVHLAPHLELFERVEAVEG